MAPEEIDRKYKIIKATLDIGDDEVSQMFGYKNAAAFRSSSARERIMTGVVRLYDKINSVKKASE